VANLGKDGNLNRERGSMSVCKGEGRKFNNELGKENHTGPSNNRGRGRKHIERKKRKLKGALGFLPCPENGEVGESPIRGGSKDPHGRDVEEKKRGNIPKRKK